jgi:hypothetical protein
MSEEQDMTELDRKTGELAQNFTELSKEYGNVIQVPSVKSSSGSKSARKKPVSFQNFLKAYLQVQKNGGSSVDLARRLNISRQTVYSKVKDLEQVYLSEGLILQKLSDSKLSAEEKKNLVRSIQS